MMFIFIFVSFYYMEAIDQRAKRKKRAAHGIAVWWWWRWNVWNASELSYAKQAKRRMEERKEMCSKRDLIGWACRRSDLKKRALTKISSHRYVIISVFCGRVIRLDGVVVGISQEDIIEINYGEESKLNRWRRFLPTASSSRWRRSSAHQSRMAFRKSWHKIYLTFDECSSCWRARFEAAHVCWVIVLERLHHRLHHADLLSINFMRLRQLALTKPMLLSHRALFCTFGFT